MARTLELHPDRLFPAVPTRTRRRNAWRIAPGKLLTIMRDGMSDVTDFLTCLSVYAVEAYTELKHVMVKLGEPDGGAA